MSKVIDEMDAAMEARKKKHPFKRVLNQHLIVQIDEFKYGGRLVIPEVAKRQPTKGKVVAVAEDITDIHVGDLVLYSQFAGYRLSFEGLPPMRVMGYNEILSILDDNAPDIVTEGV